MVGVVLLSALSLNTCLEVTVDDKVIGYVNSQSTFNAALALAEANSEKDYGMEIVGPYNTVSANTVHKLFVNKLTTEELSEKIDDNVQWLINGVILNINNGELQFAVANEAEGQKVLDTLFAENTVSDPNVVIKSIDFLEDVKLEKDE